MLNGGAHDHEIAGKVRAIRPDVDILNGRSEPLDNAEALARAGRQKLPAVLRVAKQASTY